MKTRENGKINTMWIWFVFGVGVFVEVILTLLGVGNSANSVINIIISISFFGIVFIIFGKAYRLLHIGKMIEEDLKSAVITVKSMHDDYLTRCSNAEGNEKEDIKSVCDELREKDLFFKCDVLKKAFSEYKQELSRVEKEIGNSVNGSCEVRADIQDFINMESVEEAIEEHYLSQVSGIMTGLGILGTFVGLSIGLNSFDLSGTASEVEGKISPLMDGIKVAFHTSICGMIYSLLFSYFYLKNNAKLAKAVNKFLDVFEQYVVPSTSNGSANTFVKYQERLCSHLEQNLSYQISLQAAQKALVEELEIKFSEAFSKNFSDNFSKTMEEKLVPSLEKLSGSIAGFDTKIELAQKDAIDKIVHEFLNEMNQSMETEMKEYKIAMQEATAAQKENSGMFQESLEQFQFLSGACEDFVTKIHELEGEIHNTTDQITELSGAFERYATNVSQAQNDFHNQEKNIEGCVGNILKILEILETTSPTCKKVETSIQSIKTSIERIETGQKASNDNEKKQLDDIVTLLRPNKGKGFLQENKGQLEMINNNVSDLSQMLNDTIKRNEINQMLSNLSENMKALVAEKEQIKGDLIQIIEIMQQSDELQND